MAPHALSVYIIPSWTVGSIVERKGMASPVVAVANAPKFAGLSGFKRPALGQPTSVPTGLPVFRGVRMAPADAVRAPEIQASKNRDNRGTNATIPYARLVPVDDAACMGRCGPGDVVFVSRSSVSMHHVAGMRKQRVAGIDFLNMGLGNGKFEDMVVSPHLKIGVNVLLDQGVNNLSIADEWWRLSMLSEWCLDGVVLSNDVESETSSGQNDARLFNIAVQGHAMVNNGYIDINGQGVEVQPRAHVSGNYLVTPKSNPYKMFCQQMFGRKIKALSNLYVGLVAKQNRLDKPDNIRTLLKNRSNDDINAQTSLKASNFYYTFEFKCFNDHEALSTTDMSNDSSAEPVHKRRRVDQFKVVTDKDFRNMVGAWRLGKVVDTSARKRDYHVAGPTDTTDAVTVTVSTGWVDWRSLRRTLRRKDIGADVPGASEWENFEDDDRRIFQWPTAYASSNFGKPTADANVPIDPNEGQNNVDEQNITPKSDGDGGGGDGGSDEGGDGGGDGGSDGGGDGDGDGDGGKGDGGGGDAPASAATPSTMAILKPTAALVTEKPVRPIGVVDAVGTVQSAVSKKTTAATTLVPVAPAASSLASAVETARTAPSIVTEVAKAPVMRKAGPVAATSGGGGGVSTTSDVFASIFGKSNKSGAEVSAPTPTPRAASAAGVGVDSESDSASDAQPSPGVNASRARVRRARDGR